LVGQSAFLDQYRVQPGNGRGCNLEPANRAGICVVCKSGGRLTDEGACPEPDEGELNALRPNGIPERTVQRRYVGVPLVSVSGAPHSSAVGLASGIPRNPRRFWRTHLGFRTR